MTIEKPLIKIDDFNKNEKQLIYKIIWELIKYTSSIPQLKSNLQPDQIFSATKELFDEGYLKLAMNKDKSVVAVFIYDPIEKKYSPLKKQKGEDYGNFGEHFK